MSRPPASADLASPAQSEGDAQQRIEVLTREIDQAIQAVQAERSVLTPDTRAGHSQ